MIMFSNHYKNGSDEFFSVYLYFLFFNNHAPTDLGVPRNVYFYKNVENLYSIIVCTQLKNLNSFVSCFVLSFSPTWTSRVFRIQKYSVMRTRLLSPL